MKLGDIVKLKTDEDTFGIVEFSMFGYSIHFWNDEYNSFGKTLGNTGDEMLKYWEVVDDLPEGYELNKYGLPAKVK